MKQINPGIPAKPPALDQSTEKRWQMNSLRGRMLTGNWLEDLEDELARQIGTGARRASWGVADMSSNVFKGVCSALAALYTEAPAVAATELADELLGRNGLVNRAGLWSIMQNVQYLTLGYREMFLRVDVADDGENLLYRPVSPDFIWAEASPGSPMEPNQLYELRLRRGENGLFWSYDMFDLRDQSSPIYEVRTVKSDGSLGERIGSPMSGAAYPYRSSSGVPRIPYSIYHAQLTGSSLFDSFAQSELVAGSLQAATLHTYLIHLARDCAHPQRWVMGCGLDGGSLYDGDTQTRRVAIASDPSSILVFSPDSEMQGLGQPMIGQFQAGGDEAKLLSTITLYERKLAQSAGISPATVQKVSGDPRSGYAIAMSKSDQRDAQRRFGPSMARGDINTLELSAMMANRFLGKSFPESGYQIQYSSIPLSKEEAESIRMDTIQKMEAGLMTKVDAVKVFYPDLTDQEARAYLQEVKRQLVEFA